MSMGKKSKSIIVIIFVAILTAGAIVFALLMQSWAITPQPTSSAEQQGGNILINELMASNTTAVLDDHGQYPDWLELYNPGDAAVDLNGWGLSDKKNKPVEWAFPAVQIPAKGYIVVFCSGNNQKDEGKPLHASFRLSSKGDVIILTDSSGSIVDSVEFGAIGRNASYGRVPDNEATWQTFEHFSPGFINDESGYEQYTASLQLDPASKPSLVINEVMAGNQTTLKDDKGEYSDYVELLNTGDGNISLKGFGLSDSETAPMKWQFPDITIEPGEYLLVFCSGYTLPASTAPDKNALHADFRIGSYRETIVLSDTEGRQIDKAEVSELKSDNALARNPDGEGDFKVTPKPTPGYPNTDTGYDDFIKSHSAALGDLYISEASNTNYKTIPSVLGNYYDWIELHNASDRVINLEDYGLTTNTSNPAMWRFPDKDIDPGEYMVVMASGANQKKTDQPYLHTNFRLSATGELVALFDKNGNFLDKVGVEGLRADMSYGRKDSNPDFYYFGTPTPGAVNTDGAKQTLSVPQFTLPAGKYAVAQQVEITAQDGAQIYYTTDGSDPGKNDKAYTGPVTISTPTPLRARAYEDGYLPSIIATATYLIDTLPTLPIVCLTTDPLNFSDENTGIYAKGPNASATFPYKGANFWQDWERPVHFEYIDEDGKFCVGVDAAVRIFGQYSRAMPQKGFAILAKQQYGSITIPYAFFENRPFTEYKDLVLRASGQDQPLSRIRDVLLSSLVDGQMDVDVQAFKQCVVYINGVYWGVYNLREKINEYFIAQHHDVSPTNIDLLRANGTDSQIIAGTNADWKALMEYVGAHDLSIQENYDYIASQIDVDNYIDYLVTEVFTANSDQGNIKYWKEHKPGAKWKWIPYDFCWGFFNVDHDSMQEYFSVEGTGVGNGLNNSLARGLLKNDGFRQKFLERFAYHLKNTFTKERMLEKIHELAGNIDEEMKRDRVRWPVDSYGNSAGTYVTWKSSQIKRLETFAEKREGWVLWSIKKYFNYTDEQMKEIFGKAGTKPSS